MLVLITYDVCVTDIGGTRRLRRVSKECQNYGQRVQNSVFECHIDSATMKLLEYKLINIIDKNKDSLRIYYLGDKYEDKVKHFGTKETYDINSSLII